MIWYLIGFLDALACGFVILCGYGAARKRENLSERQMAVHTNGGEKWTETTRKQGAKQHRKRY